MGTEGQAALVPTRAARRSAARARRRRHAAWQLRSALALVAIAAMLAVGLPVFTSEATADPCAPPLNEIACENSLPGDDSPWNAAPPDASLQGFPTDISVNRGQTIRFKIQTDAPAYTIDIYRIGWYQGLGSRKVATISPSAPLPQSQPACLTDPTTGLVDCGNWGVSAQWNVPANAVSGVYFAYLRRPDTGGTNHILFVVRNDSSTSDILFQTADPTWHAYNTWGGASLYQGNGPGGSGAPGRAYKVSYNRPIFGENEGNRFWNSEYYMVRWLERNGYDVSYQAGVDTDRLAASILQQHEIFMNTGHDEYWSGTQRANVEAARDSGTHLAFFSGNDVFWKTRYEPSIDGSGTSHRTLVCYKETLAHGKIDPSPEWTGTWRDPRFSPPSNGGRPENELLGNIFTVNGTRDDELKVPATFKNLRFWRNTSVASLPVGGEEVFPAGTLGYEWNADLDNGFRPAGTFQMSSTTVTMEGGYVIQDYGSNYGSGTQTHSLTMYRAPSGALVFGAGTVQWSWGLDPGLYRETRTMQQATVNLLADMGVQPATRQANLVAATASTDVQAPTAAIGAPASGADVPAGQPVTITGTASDLGGGVVAGVEVSTDGGTSWRRATGTSSWSYTWVPSVLGAASIRARAVDDSANLGAAVTRPVNVVLSCPCKIWGANPTPTVQATGDQSSVVLGTRFRSSMDGVALGVRFYKGPGNTGTHTGSLWTVGGQLLSSAVFTNETATGWQEVTFPAPVSINANTTYVAAYHAPVGRYSLDQYYFQNGPVTTGVLTAEGGAGVANGVFEYGGPTTFPDQSFQQSNYWVDVIFGPDIYPPVVVSSTPSGGSTGVPVSTQPSATFNKAVQPATIDFDVTNGGNPVPGTVVYDAPTRTARFVPTGTLPSGVTLTATVSGAVDNSGNTMQGSTQWSFMTGGIGACPCTIWPSYATPTNASSGDAGSVNLGVKFRSESPGLITGVRFYKGQFNTGTHVGSLWSSAGQLLATATFTSETATGWQQVTFSQPVQINADTTYVASYFAPNGGYAFDPGYFSTAGFDNPPLRALRSGVDGVNGLFTYAGGNAFPNQGFLDTNYWVDVVFTPDTAGPQVTGRTPSPNATGVPQSVKPTATFNEAVTPASISFELRNPQNQLVEGTTAYDALTRTATFTPSATLASGTTYTATVSATDVSGNPMTTPAQWSFTTGGITGCPCTIFPSDSVPGTASAPDGASLEVGVKFRPDANGVITGVRFYKGAANTGTHQGSLWTSGGQLLARATFTNESATGWQQVSFSTPVPVLAGTTYVASYHAPNGGYARDLGYFTGGPLVNSPLEALGDGVSGPNGVFTYSGVPTFPTNGVSGANFWVDVVFSAATVVTAGDLTTANFAAGSPGSTTYVSETANGEVILAPAIGTEFGGSTIPAGFQSQTWSGGARSTVSAGTLKADGTRVRTTNQYSNDRALEFLATFRSGAANQNVGFSQTTGAAPWAMFSTRGGGSLWARTSNGTLSAETNLGAALLNGPHTFRIDWLPGSVIFSVDGTIRATHSIAVPTPQRVVMSDRTVGGAVLTVDWVRLQPYAPTGTFTSRVLDSGSAASTWGPVLRSQTIPVNANVEISVRTGNTAVPDATWGPWVPTPAGVSVAQTGRYAQYQLVLTRGNAGLTPAVQDVTLTSYR